jgi:hypothetical protein
MEIIKYYLLEPEEVAVLQAALHLKRQAAKIKRLLLVKKDKQHK